MSTSVVFLYFHKPLKKGTASNPLVGLIASKDANTSACEPLIFITRVFGNAALEVETLHVNESSSSSCSIIDLTCRDVIILVLSASVFPPLPTAFPLCFEVPFKLNTAHYSLFLLLLGCQSATESQMPEAVVPSAPEQTVEGGN